MPFSPDGKLVLFPTIYLLMLILIPVVLGVILLMGSMFARGPAMVLIKAAMKNKPVAAIPIGGKFMELHLATPDSRGWFLGKKIGRVIPNNKDLYLYKGSRILTGFWPESSLQPINFDLAKSINIEVGEGKKYSDTAALEDAVKPTNFNEMADWAEKQQSPKQLEALLRDSEAEATLDAIDTMPLLKRKKGAGGLFIIFIIIAAAAIIGGLMVFGGGGEPIKMPDFIPDLPGL